jgi:hypothetical protein
MLHFIKLKKKGKKNSHIGCIFLSFKKQKIKFFFPHKDCIILRFGKQRNQVSFTEKVAFLSLRKHINQVCFAERLHF